MSLFRLGVAAVIAVAGAVVLPAVAHSLPTGIAPFLDCVTYDPSSNTVTANFGYVSANSGTVIVSVGPENFVSPDPEDRGQVTAFNPGANQDSWQTTFSLSDETTITWTLLGQSVTAGNVASEYCDTQPGPPGPPGPQGPEGPQGPPGISSLSQVSANPVSVLPGQRATASATCSSGDTAIGGGYQTLGQGQAIFGAVPEVLASFAAGQAWTVTVENPGFLPLRFQVDATCASLS